MPNWEPHRSILRDAMIETFVSQHFTDPTSGSQRCQHFSGRARIRSRRKYLEQICEIVSRIDVTMHSRASSTAVDDFKLASPNGQRKADQLQLPLSVGSSRRSTYSRDNSDRQYTITDFSASGLRPNASRFYEGGYRPILRQMVALVVATEAPIYEDIMVERIARAHGFQRSGNNIYQIIKGVIGRDSRGQKKMTEL